MTTIENEYFRVSAVSNKEIYLSFYDLYFDKVKKFTFLIEKNNRKCMIMSI